MPPMVIEEPQPGAILLQPADFDPPGHMPPRAVAIGRPRARLASEDQEPAGQGACGVTARTLCVDPSAT